MYFDALTAAAVSDELRATVLGGFVQKVVLTDRSSVALEIYAHHRRRYLLLTAEPADPRALLLSVRPTSAPGLVTPFGLLLRKHVLDGVISEIEQPAAERIISMSISKRSEPNNTTVWLQAELMGRHSNLLLLDAERTTVLESARRVTPEMSRVRPVLPKKPYTPPPARGGVQPHRLTPQDLEEAASGAKPSTPLWQTLVSAVAGLSPLAAREIVHRAGGDPAVRASEWSDWPRLATETRRLASLWATREWRPCVASTEDGPAAYAPYELTHLQGSAQLSFPESISEAIEACSGSTARIASHAQLRDQILAELDRRADQVRQRLASLRREREGAEDAGRLMEDGRMVLAYSHAIEPGAEELRLEDRTIRLDPELSPQENAQRLFDEYRRRRRATEELPKLIERAEEELALTEEYRTYAGLASGHAELAQLRQEAAAAGALREAQPGGRKQPPAPKVSSFTAPDGTRVLVGKSAAQNARVLDAASPGDWWFHARDGRGGHVVARTGGAEPSTETLTLAAETAAYYSSLRESPSVEVVYTQIRNVRRIKGSWPGHVTYRNERSARVRPRDHLGESG